jgi:hypothetical protein
MSRIIQTDSTGKQRGQLVRAAALALRELARQADDGTEARDLTAFVVVALRTISDGIDESVAAWEKRGYWVKADKFRMEWSWTSRLSDELGEALRKQDWAQVASTAMKVAAQLSDVRVAEKHRMGRPWVGAYERWLAEAPAG